MKKAFPDNIKQEICKMHHAGKRHNNICTVIGRKHNIELTKTDVYNVVHENLEELMEVEERNKSHD